MHARASLVAVLFVSACVPDTDLTDERTRRPTPEAASGVTLVRPAPGATGVPRNLASVVVAFADPPASAPTLRLAGSKVAAQPGAPEPPEPCGESVTCFRWRLTAALAAGGAYEVEVESEGRTARPGGFVTGPDLDTTAPRIADVSVALAGPCLRVRFSVDEPVEASVAVGADGGEIRTTVAAAGGDVDFGMRVDSLAADTAGEIRIVAIDAAGNPADPVAVGVRTPRALPPLAITEVLANPAGTEPTQEFVEIRNLGAESLPLGGLRIADAAGSDLVPAADLAPGGLALCVPSGFDAASPKDVAPRAGTTLLRVDTRLGGDGLANGGDAVTLLAVDGSEISRYGGWIDVSASSWNGKSVHRRSAAACDAPSAWSRQPLPPTPGW